MAISDLNLVNSSSGVTNPLATKTVKPTPLVEGGWQGAEQMMKEAPQPTGNLKFTVTELGQFIKQQKPDLFGQFSDEEVGAKLIERKPELSQFIVEPEEKSGFFSTLLKNIAKPFARVGVTALGAVAPGLTSQVVPRTDVNEYGYNAQGEKLGDTKVQYPTLPWLGEIKPIGADITQGEVGKGVRDVLGTGLELGSYAIGGSLAKGSGTLGSKVATGFKAGSAIGGTSGLGIGLQDENATLGSVLGSTALGAGVGGVLGMVFPLAEAGVNKTMEAGKGILNKVSDRLSGTGNNLPGNVDQATGNVFQKMGKKIQNTIIKPSQKDISSGYKIDNVAKYDLGGDLATSYNKTVQRLNEFTGKLNSLLEQSGDKKLVNLGDLVDDLQREYSGKGLASLGNQKTVSRTIQNIVDELDMIKPDWRADPLTLLDAIQTKRQVGQFTAFLHDPLKKGSSAEEEVWNSFYMLLKDATEKESEASGIQGLREVNRAISDVIPIQQAIIRRIPVAERNNIFSLTDIIGGTGMFVHPGAIAVPLAQRLMKSGTFAEYLMKMGEQATAPKNVTLRAAKSIPLPKAAPRINISTKAIAPLTSGVLRSKQK